MFVAAHVWCMEALGNFYPITIGVAYRPVQVEGACFAGKIMGATKAAIRMAERVDGFPADGGSMRRPSE